MYILRRWEKSSSFPWSADSITATSDEPPEHELVFIIEVNVTSTARFAPARTTAHFSMAEGLFDRGSKVAVGAVYRPIM